MKVRTKTIVTGVPKHRRGYHLGDMRCRSCWKWFNPANPKEMAEVGYAKNGKMMHKDCWSVNPIAIICKKPKHRGMRRLYLSYEAKRY